MSRRVSVPPVFNTLKRDGTTVLLTTHYVEEANQLCDSRRPL